MAKRTEYHPWTNLTDTQKSALRELAISGRLDVGRSGFSRRTLSALAGRTLVTFDGSQGTANTAQLTSAGHTAVEALGLYE